MASGRLVLLSDDEIAHIHETSLKILQEIGIKVLSKKVQSLLAENGAEVDSAHSLANIPSSLVERAKEKVREILSKHSLPPIDGDVRAEIDQIVCDCEKSIL